MIRILYTIILSATIDIGIWDGYCVQWFRPLKRCLARFNIILKYDQLVIVVRRWVFRFLIIPCGLLLQVRARDWSKFCFATSSVDKGARLGYYLRLSLFLWRNGPLVRNTSQIDRITSILNRIFLRNISLFGNASPHGLQCFPLSYPLLIFKMISCGQRHHEVRRRGWTLKAMEHRVQRLQRQLLGLL